MLGSSGCTQKLCLYYLFKSRVHFEERLHEKCFLTLKQRADFPPAGDASFTGELTQSSLQEKHRNAAAHEEDDIRDEERTLTHTQNINNVRRHLL